MHHATPSCADKPTIQSFDEETEFVWRCAAVLPEPEKYLERI
jgi:hypothetical protein